MAGETIDGVTDTIGHHVGDRVRAAIISKASVIDALTEAVLGELAGELLNQAQQGGQ